MSITSRSAAPMLAGALVFAFATAALAAPAAPGRTPSRTGDAGQAQKVSVTDGEDEAASATCSKTRKRLWIEGEGWIVRKVTTCR